jgi:hypothetical protein
MNSIKNEYQLSKTLRFGLTKKKKLLKDDCNEIIYESHTELKELVLISEKKIMESVYINQKAKLDLSVDQIDTCLSSIKNFIDSWKGIYPRADQIAIDKDYYKILCKKITFDGFWIDEKTKTKKPQSRTILLSELSKKDASGKERKQHILDYWKNNIFSAIEKYEVVSRELKQFQKALKIQRTDNKPNEVELRKLFLSLANIILDILKPLVNGQICFPKIEKLDISKTDNKNLIDFATNHKFQSDLLNEIAELQHYFEENGSNVPFCRASLNPKTIIKSKLSTDNNIDKEIKQLGLDRILNEYLSAPYFDNSIIHLSAKEKLNKIEDKKENYITRGLLFKYKPIQIMLHHEIAKTLSKEIGKSEENIIEFLGNIGQIKSPAKDYEVSKEDFNINNYPLKVAFDFAWENVARNLYHTDTHAPIDECRKFLADNFDIKIEDNNLKLYANLLELNALLSTLKYGKPKDETSIKQNIKDLLNKISWNEIGKSGQKNKTNIENWLNNKDKIDNQNGIENAKKQIGLFRGSLKNKVPKYYKLTETYKDISMKMGKIFATMRDKITDEAELNKVSHYAMIVEDDNKDKYILLQEFTDKKEECIYSKTQTHNSDFTTYSVNSITSSAIAKMIRKVKAEELRKNQYNKDTFSIEETKEEKENRIIKEWKQFLKDKQWDYEFNLDTKNKNFEELKKEIDSKCYKLNISYIDKKTITDLVENKNCLLLPIINQDLSKEEKTQNNQFTKDWDAIFSQNTPWRLTPEFRISYRKPTPNYPISDKGDKRYSRFQMIGHFLCDYIPQSNTYISNREQIANYKDNEKQEQAVQCFHDKLLGKTEKEAKNEKLIALQAKFGSISRTNITQEKKKEKFYVFGIDRGQKELATLCVIDQDKKIIDDFDIYTRSFNSKTKQWDHTFLEKRAIMDLSNLRVETTISIDGKTEKKKVLVDLSKVKVKDKQGHYSKPDKMQIKMQQLAYIRKLQFQIQTNPDVVLAWYSDNNTQDLILENFVRKDDNDNKGLVSFYGAAVEELKDTLPIEEILNMLKQFKELKEKEKAGENVKYEIDRLIQLEPVDNLKTGVVANMVGVIAFLLEKFNYQVYISLEDLSQPFDNKINGGITGVPIKTNKESGRMADVEKYAGLGLYNFFEMQLLKKLFRIQQKSTTILHLVPAFRAQKNYDHVTVGQDNIKGQFGIVFFVNANATSKTCPICGANNSEKPDKNKYPNAHKELAKDGKEVWIERDKSNGNDIIRCFVCGFDTTKTYEDNPAKFIKSGDDNAAYLISVSAIKAYELATILAIEKYK